jgi:hypothetical protein
MSDKIEITSVTVQLTTETTDQPIENEVTVTVDKETKSIVIVDLYLDAITVNNAIKLLTKAENIITGAY